MQVLLIDDHTLFRLGLKNLLERSGIQVAAATSSGEEGLRIVHEVKPDVVLLDMRMPDMDGLEVLRRLREAGVEVPITMLTTSNEERDLVESLRNGAQGYLLKSASINEVVEAVRKTAASEAMLSRTLPPSSLPSSAAAPTSPS